MSQEARWLLSPDPRRKEREAAFRQYDEMVCAVLSELKSAMFPQTYHVETVVLLSNMILAQREGQTVT